MKRQLHSLFLDVNFLSSFLCQSFVKMIRIRLNQGVRAKKVQVYISKEALRPFSLLPCEICLLQNI